jgi:hypothetical protein
MLDQDQRMEGMVSKMRIFQGKGEEGTQAWKDAMNEYAEKIEFYDLPVKIDQNRFIEKLNTRIVEIIGRQWDFWYGLTLKYKDAFGYANVLAIYKTPEGFQLGSWQSNQRYLYQNGKLSPDRIKRLEEIGFTWDLLEEKFEKGFQETLSYKERNGNTNAPASYKTPEGYPLGLWQSTLRLRYKKSKLFSDRIKRLDEIGFTWDPFEEQFEKGFRETLLYQERTGSPNSIQGYKTDEGYNLGIWQGRQRRQQQQGKLSPERIKRLEEIGFTWDPFEEQFEKGFQETLIYKESTGNPNVQWHYETSEGYRLGTWDILEEQFEKGFQETLLYKEKTGNPNASQGHKTPECYQLGKWQGVKRGLYKKNKLSVDRIKRLEEIGFTWDLLEEKFENGFQQTLLYKERTGNPNAPHKYKTVEGFQLGQWQNTQRKSYIKRKISSERIKRLNDIGFKWKRK